MLFGYPEMREFAKDHEDPRIRAIWKRLEECRRKNEQWCAETIKLKELIRKLEDQTNE